MLSGAESCLAEHRPTLIIETSKADCVRRLSDIGYAVFQIHLENLLFIPTHLGIDLTKVDCAFPSEGE